MIDIILATHNRDKQKELSKALNSKDVNILSLQDFPEIGEIIEDGETLTDNALIKAREVYKITGIPSISDDTGLEVDALNGDPGVFSARYAGEKTFSCHCVDDGFCCVVSSLDSFSTVSLNPVSSLQILIYKNPGFSKFKIFIFKFASSELEIGTSIKQLKTRGIILKYFL